MRYCCCSAAESECSWTGVSVAAVAAWLGDTRATVLATYTHLMPGDSDSGRQAVDSFFAEPVTVLPASDQRVP